MGSDSALKHAVEAELACHPCVDDRDIVVNVVDGVVSLSGYARNLFQKYGAEDAVQRVAGVRAIANDIDLERGIRRNPTDSEIAREAVIALKRVLPLSCDRICPVVSERRVILEGTVNNNHDRELAAEIVRRFTDVVAVVNKITLAHSVPAAEPGEIERPLEDSVGGGTQLDPEAITPHALWGEVRIRGRASGRCLSGIPAVKN
jgi:osmotically-inducible protein OsmY